MFPAYGSYTDFQKQISSSLHSNGMPSKKVDGKYYRHECNRCGYVWYTQTSSPKCCSNKECRSPYWDKPRARNTRYGNAE